MPKRSIPQQVTSAKSSSYKRDSPDQNDGHFDHQGKKQSDYRRMQSYKALEEYFDSFKK